MPTNVESWRHENIFFLPDVQLVNRSQETTAKGKEEKGGFPPIPHLSATDIMLYSREEEEGEEVLLLE